MIDINIQTPDHKISALHLFHSVKDKDTIEYFLSKKKINISVKDKHGNSPLHYAAYSRNEYLV
jgi:ankyrin repeat protein